MDISEQSSPQRRIADASIASPGREHEQDRYFAVNPQKME
jgi:hypothetical protein